MALCSLREGYGQSPDLPQGPCGHLHAPAHLSVLVALPSTDHAPRLALGALAQLLQALHILLTCGHPWTLSPASQELDMRLPGLSILSVDRVLNHEGHHMSRKPI